MISHSKLASLLGAGLVAGLTAFPGIAGEADVVGATISRTGQDVYVISATIRHADSGWEHYADAFEVLAGDGSILGTRVLLHPHENEQPFTRSLTGVVIPQAITSITVRARDKVHGYGGAELELAVPQK